MLLRLGGRHPIEDVKAVVTTDELAAQARKVWEIRVDESLRRYIVALIQATRTHPDLALGASPRGTMALFRSAQARAALHGNDYVLPDDIQALAQVCLAHRCIVKPESALRGRTAEAVIADILQQTPLDLGGEDSA